jgi:hypothetical protein
MDMPIYVPTFLVLELGFSGLCAFERLQRNESTKDVLCLFYLDEETSSMRVFLVYEVVERDEIRGISEHCVKLLMEEKEILQRTIHSLISALISDRSNQSTLTPSLKRVGKFRIDNSGSFDTLEG